MTSVMTCWAMFIIDVLNMMLGPKIVSRTEMRTMKVVSQAAIEARKIASVAQAVTRNAGVKVMTENHGRRRHRITGVSFYFPAPYYHNSQITHLYLEETVSY